MADWQLIEEGLKRGYSLDEVTDIIAKEEGVDPSYARERGFDSPAILRRLGYVKPEAPKAEGSGLLRRAGDYGLSAIKSAIAVPEIAVGLADIATGGQAGKAAESVGFKPKEAKEILDSYLTPEQQAANKAVHEAEGFMPTIKAAIEHPSTIAHSVVESSGPMLAGGVAGRGLLAVAPKIAGGATTAAAIGEGVAGAGSTAEQIRQQSSNGELSANQSGMALASGVGTAAFGFVGGRLAQKLGINDVDAMLVKAGSQYTSKGVVRRIVEGGISEGVFEELPQSTQEQIWQNAALDRPLMEGVENSAAMGMLAGVAMGGAGGFVPSGTNPRPPANVTPPPSITSASSTDDAIKAFKDEVETVSPAPRGSFSGMDDLAGLIESERSDLGKRRGLLAQQQQEARDMEAEFSELVKDEQIDQSYWLNDAQKQMDAERAREGGYDLALQQREEQQGRTVEQLAAASEAQGFGNEEPTAMQLAMQQAQQKALDNEFSGLLKQERASLNEMRANVKRVAGVPVEQISTPQLEEIAQSEAHPNTKMAAVAALNDRHDAIQQERERLMQLRETRLEKQSNQPEQGAQHGAESHGTDGQVATPSVAGGGANVSGGGFDAAMVAADRGMRETASAGAAVSSGGQVGAVPVADQPTNVRALTENGKPSASWVIRNKETGESLFETFDRKKVDALNTEKYEAVPILEYLQSLNKPRAESPNDAQIVNVRQHTTRRKPASNTIAQAIINLGGISTSLKTDILGDASIKTRPGLFTTNGTGDLGEIAAMLSSGFGFSQIDLNDPTDNSGAKQLADLIARSVNGESILNEEAMIRAQQDEEFEQAKAEVNLQAQEIGIKPIRGKRTIDIVQSEINAILAEREEMSRQKKKAQLLLDEVAEQELIEAFDLAMQEYHDETAISRDESRVESARLSAEESAQGDGDSVNQASPVAGRASPTEGGRGEAEVTPEFGLVGQTEAEARAEQGRLNQPEGLTKEQIDREATAPFSLHSDVLPPAEGPSGETSSMFTPDGRATRQAANISDDHANIPNMDGVRAAAQQILDAIEQDDLADYGLRVIPGEFEGDIAVGDVLPPSRVWEDGRETDDELLGTSTVEVGSLTLDGVLKSLNGLGAAGKPGPNGYYFGDRVVLVKGDRVSGGDDSGESLLKNASVVGVWRKASKGLSSILPNEAVAPKESGANTLDPIAAVKATLDAAGVTGTDRTTTIAAVRRGDLTPEDVAEAHPSPNVADSASEGKPIRQYATPDERNEAIWTLQAEAKSSGLEYSNESIKDAAEFGAPANEIAAAIDAGEDAVADLAERYAKRSNGLRQGFGQGNNDNALRENMKPPSEHEKRIASLTGRGLYELTEAQRSSLLKFAKVRSIDAFEEIAFSARREIIGRWLDMNPAVDKRSSDVAMFSRGRGNLRSRPRGEITHETQRLEKEINRDLSRQGKEAIGATGFITRSAVPDNARRLVAAVEKLFGVRVEFVQVGDERANIFNGVFLGGNTLFVNVDSSSPVSTVIGHEFLHFLKESNPDLYAKAESDLLALANAKKFAAAATKHQPAMNAGEEVIADTFGDQFSNPEFWEEMANRVEPSLFMRIRAAFTRFMGKLLGEIKAMGTTHKTDALYSDLDAVRDAVLSATVGAAKGRKLATPSWSNLHARFMTAWHGSPHDHDGFDSSKIGTGEGAQAYGYGLYFSGAREVAEWYRDKLTDGAAERKLASIANNQTPAKKGSSADVLVRLINQNNYLNNYDIKSAGLEPEAFGFQEIDDEVKVSSLARYQYGARDYATQTIDGVEQSIYLFGDGSALLDNGEELKAVSDNHKGRLYQVELAPEQDEYLDWDKPLSEQSEKVREALIRAGVIVDGKYGDGFGATPMFPGWSTFTGESIHRRIVNREFEKQREVTAAARKRAEQAASKYLHSIGIRGIKYLDGSSRPSIWKYDVDVFGSSGSLLKQHRVRTKAEADDIVADAEASGRAAKVKQIQQPDDQNHNYVIFDDADVKITAKESRRASNDLDFTQPQGSEPLRKTSFGYANDTHNLFHATTINSSEGDIHVFHAHDPVTGELIGSLGLGLNGDEITVLYNIKDETNSGGFGEKILRSLLAGSKDGLYIVNMLPDAVGFWKKVGVSLDDHLNGAWEHGNGILTEQALTTARGEQSGARESKARYEQAFSGGGGSEKGGETNKTIPSGRVTNETTPANAGVSVSAPSESVRRIQAVVERFKSQFKGTSALDIRVVSTTFDIPARFRPSPFAEGVFHDDAGLVYLVTMNLHNPRGELSENRAWQVLLHESVGHYGLSQMMGDKFAGILKAVKQATLAGRKVSETQSNPLQPGDKDYTTWEAVQLRYPDATDAELAQEVLARMSETDPGSSVLGYAVAVVRQWVREMARAMGINLVVSTSELRDLVAKASGYMRRGDNLAEERVPSGLVAASQKVGAGETAFNLVDVTSDAFKKWFGDSKVVDAGGNPLRVYHGTDADLTEFKRVDSRTGHPSAQLGVFFTASAKVADRFNRVKTDLPFSDIGKLDFAEGANQLPVYLSIKNPAVLSAKEFRDLMVDLGSPPDKVYGWMRTPEGWAALRDHFINAEGRDGVKILAERNVYSGSGLEEYAADQYVAFNPTQIKSAISNTGAFDSTNPSILESRAAQGKPQGPIWNSPESSRADDVIYTMQDKNIDLKRVQQAIKEAVGEIRDDIDAYLQEELFHGRAAKITEEFLDKEVNPLISLMRASNVSMDELETFLWARHAKERNAQIAKINEAMPDGGSGLTNKQADDLMAGKDVTIGDKTIAGVKPARKKLLSDLAGRVDAITSGNRALLERYSLESADTLNAWDGAYKHYVPLHREDADSHLAGMGTGMGYSVKGASSKRATGSSRPVENILANLALQRERIITRGEKNRVAQSLYGLAKEMPNADLWEVDVKPTIRTTAMVEGREQVVDAVDPNFRNRPNVVFARFNGEDHFIVFNERNERAVRMAQALKNLDADDISHLLGEVSRWTRYFASINTQYNPIFGVTNLVRDIQTGLLNLKSTPIEGKQKELMGHLVQALPAVFKALRAGRKGQAATGTWAQLWEEFQEVGGQTGYRNMFRNGQERAEALQNALDPTWWQKTWWGKAATVGGVLAVPEQFLLDAKYGGKWVFNLLSDYNTMMENGIRLSAYKVALDSGMTKERAASLAKNLTVNFNRKGQAARQVGALYAFFNASVQGTARMAETLNHGAKPGELLGKAGKQIVYGGLLLGAVQAMLLMAAGFDDEEPPEFVRDRNIIIPTGNGKYVSIPMPLGFHVLPAISRISIEFTAGGFKKPGEHLVHIMDVLLDSFNPIGNAGLSMQTVAPTVLDPIAALTENKDWSGRQIARQDFSKLNPTPGHTRAKDTASSLSRGIAYALNYLSGGGEYGIGVVSPTPDQIDYLLGQLTGGVGRELGKVVTTAEALTTGEDLPPHKIPLVGRFYGDTTGQSSEASKFYGTLEKLSEHKGTLDRMKDARDAEAYREYAKEHPESRFYDRANKVQRELSSLRKLKRKMIERNADRAKVRQIEDRMRTLMTRFNQAVSEQEGNHR